MKKSNRILAGILSILIGSQAYGADFCKTVMIHAIAGFGIGVSGGYGLGLLIKNNKNKLLEGAMKVSNTSKYNFFKRNQEYYNHSKDIDFLSDNAHEVIGALGFIIGGIYGCLKYAFQSKPKPKTPILIASFNFKK